MKKWPTEFSPTMTALGTTLVSVGVKREGGVPIAGDTCYCLRWVVRFFGLRTPAEVTPEQWKQMDDLQTHIFQLRDQPRLL